MAGWNVTFSLKYLNHHVFTSSGDRNSHLVQGTGWLQGQRAVLSPVLHDLHKICQKTAQNKFLLHCTVIIPYSFTLVKGVRQGSLGPVSPK
jgi:hypothetical protein